MVKAELRVSLSLRGEALRTGSDGQPGGVAGGPGHAGVGPRVVLTHVPQQQHLGVPHQRARLRNATPPKHESSLSAVAAE